MKLQVAIDELGLADALDQIAAIEPYVDIIEIGTPFLMQSGMKAVTKLKEKFPNKEILCDAKIMDAGAYETSLAIAAGADFVTVLGVTDDRTIKGCVNEARKTHQKVVVDMLCVRNLATRITEVEALGVDVVAVHVGADQQAAGRTPLEDLKVMKQYAKVCQVAVAGGINMETINEYVALHPDIVIIGSGILNANDQLTAAKTIFERLQMNNN